MTKIAIIGTGLAGLSCATFLNDQVEVTLFEKARGVSGRMSTRRASPYAFDHGAQYFTAKSDAFKTFLTPLKAAGIVARWDARFAEIANGTLTKTRIWDASHPHYVGAPGMNSLGKFLAASLNVKLETRITKLVPDDHGWTLLDENGQTHGPYDWVISAVPAHQAAELMPESLEGVTRIKDTKMNACYALMLGFEHDLVLPFDAAQVSGSDISWISVNSSKPGREGPYALQVHSTNAYAEMFIDADREAVKAHLMAEVSAVIGHDVSKAVHSVVHGWRYANIAKQEGASYLLDDRHKLGVIGDWLIEGRVEAAFTSGHELANKIKQQI